MGSLIFYKKNTDLAFMMSDSKTILGISKASVEALIDREISKCPSDSPNDSSDDLRWYLGCFRWQFLIDSARAYREKFDRCERQYLKKESKLFSEIQSIASSKLRIDAIEQSPMQNECLLLLEICAHVNQKFSFSIDFIGSDMSDANYVIYRNEKTFLSTKKVVRGIVRLSEILSIHTDNGRDFIVESKTGYISLNLYDY